MKLWYHQKYGLEMFKAKSVVFATGCRERTKENLQIPGTRPAGIYGAGLAQTLINIHNLRIGKKVVIQGAGDIGLIMTRRLILEGYEVVAVFERFPYLSGLIRNKIQCLDHFDLPLFFSTEIVEISGKDRVEGVYVKSLLNGSNLPEYVECDTVLFSVGLIPELELPRKAGVKISNNFNPDVNSKFESSIDGLFFCGNCMHINDLADTAAVGGEKAAKAVFEYLTEKQRFSGTVTSDLPYEKPNKNIDYNYDFFEQLRKSEERVCIICPKNGCKRGLQYFEASKKCNKQRLSTMSSGPDRNPIISKVEIPVKDLIKARKLLKTNSTVIDDGHICIRIENNNYIFRKSKIFSNNF